MLSQASVSSSNELNPNFELHKSGTAIIVLQQKHISCIQKKKKKTEQTLDLGISNPSGLLPAR